jgi:cytochrome c oxidase assembly protein subunit 11
MKNKNIVWSIGLGLLTMICLTYASVPLYRLFCQMTGYGGTARIFVPPSEKVGHKKIKVSFNADLEPKLQWVFEPKQLYVDVVTGENKLIFYKAENLTDKIITGMASYNVTPELAGKYFNKVECFCFERQTLKPNQKVLMPVLFFIDPAIEKDEDLKDIYEITLSYNFYKIDDQN